MPTPLQDISNYRFAIIAAAAVSIGSANYGIDAASLSGFLAMPEYVKAYGTYNHTTKKYAISASRQLQLSMIALAAACVSAMISGEMSSRLGRRKSMSIAGAIGCLGGILQITAPGITQIFVAKIFIGTVFGFAASFIPPYLAEIAPAHLRGIFVSSYTVVALAFQIVAAVMIYCTHAFVNKWAYRGPMVPAVILPGLFSIIVWFFPESPRWLMTKGRREEAARALTKLGHAHITQAEVDEQLDSIAVSLAHEEALGDRGSYAELFKGTNRRRTGIVLWITFFVQYSGTSFLTSYATYYFELCGFKNPFLISILLQVFATLGGVLEMSALKFASRRVVLITGGCFEIVFMLLFAIVGTVDGKSVVAGRFLAASIVIFTFFLHGSSVPIGWLLAAEIPSNHLRSKTLALASWVNWICTLSLSAWLPYAINPLYGNLGTKMGFIFTPFIVASVIYIYFCLPEVNGRTLEEVDELFFRKVPARQFATFDLTKAKESDILGDVEQPGDIYAEKEKTPSE